MVTPRTVMKVIWVCVAFFLPTISKLSNTSGNKDHSWTRTASTVVLDHDASSPTSSSHSRKCTSLPFGGDCKGEFTKMLVAMGIRAKKELFNENWSPNIKPFPLDMTLFGLSGGQTENNLQNLVRK